MVELVVVMGILMTVVGAVLGVMESMTSSERRTSLRIDDEQNVRFVIAAVSRDLRAANPVLVAPAGVDPHRQLDLCVGDTGAAGPGPCTNGQTQVRWSYDGVGTLTRAVVVSSTPSSTQVLQGVANATTVPVFTWFRRPSATDLALATDLSPVDLAACATSVQVTVVAGSRAGVAPVSESTELAVRNQGGGHGCS